MTRPIDTATLSALESDSVQIIYFIELLIDQGSPETALRLHSGLGTITWGSRTWTGAGSLLAIGTIQETNEINPVPFRASLSGMSSAVTNIVFNTNYYRKPCLAYIGALSDGALVADPNVFFSGFIEKMDMSIGAQDGDKVELTAENEFMLFKRSRNIRYTDRQLQSEYSGDLGFEFLEFTAKANVIWRGKNNGLGGGSGSTGTPVSPRDVFNSVTR